MTTSFDHRRFKVGYAVPAVIAAAVIAVLAWQWLASQPVSASVEPASPVEGPQADGSLFLNFKSGLSDDAKVGEPITLEFTIWRHGSATAGGVTVSFPGLTDAGGAGTSSCTPGQGTVTTVSYSNGESGSTVAYTHSGSADPTGHLVVESEYTN